MAARENLSQNYLQRYYIDIFRTIELFGVCSDELSEKVSAYRKLFHQDSYDHRKHPAYVSSDEILKLGSFLFQLKILIHRCFNLSPKYASSHSNSWVNETCALTKSKRLEHSINYLVHRTHGLFDDIKKASSSWHITNYNADGLLKDVKKMNSEFKTILDDVKRHYKGMQTIEQRRVSEREKENKLRKQSQDIKQLEAENEKRRLLVDSESAANERAKLKLREQKQKIDQAAFQNLSKVNDIPLSYFLSYLKEKFDSLSKQEVSGETHSKLFDTYTWLKAIFSRNGMIDPDRLEELAPDVKRINQMETLMDLYGEKIHRVKNDDSLDDEERQMKIEYWLRLRDRDIAELEK